MNPKLKTFILILPSGELSPGPYFVSHQSGSDAGQTVCAFTADEAAKEIAPKAASVVGPDGEFALLELKPGGGGWFTRYRTKAVPPPHFTAERI